jgi:hypothetical protein
MLPQHDKRTHLHAPETETELALWTPIYWEPILLSGERITAIIAAVGLEGKISIARCIRDDVLKALFPDNYYNALSLISWIAQSLEKHLVNSGSLSDWDPPLTGFHVGDTHEAFTSNIEELPRQVVPLCSSLSVVDLASTLTSKQSTEISLDRLRASIKKNVLTLMPHLEQSFSKQVFVIDGGRKPTIDFIGNKLAANFSRLGSSNLARHVKDTKAQILDLATYKDRNNLFKEEMYKVLIWSPEVLDQTESRQARLIDEAFLEIEEDGRRLGLGVASYSNPNDAARMIYRAENAA